MAIAVQFVAKLRTFQSDKEREKIQRYFESDDEDNQIIGVRMKRIWSLSKPRHFPAAL